MSAVHVFGDTWRMDMRDMRKDEPQFDRNNVVVACWISIPTCISLPFGLHMQERFQGGLIAGRHLNPPCFVVSASSAGMRAGDARSYSPTRSYAVTRSAQMVHQTDKIKPDKVELRKRQRGRSKKKNLFGSKRERTGRRAVDLGHARKRKILH